MVPRWLVWPIFALIMGFVLGGSFFWGLYGPNTTIEQADAAYKNQGTKQEPAAEKEKADEALARYTFWLTAFTGVLAFATIGLGIATVGLYLTGEKQAKIAKLASLRQFRQTRDSLHLTKQSTDIAERSLVAGQRAWVHVDIRLNGGLVFDEHGNGGIHLVYRVKNIGHSPATNVCVNSCTFVQNVSDLTPISKYNEFCEVVRMRGEMPILSYTLFPDEYIDLQIFETISSDQIQEVLQAWRERMGHEWKYFVPYIVGCITYRIPFDDRQHQTGFMRELKRRQPAFPPGIEGGMFTVEERTVDANDVLLFNSPWGSPSID